MKRRWSHARSRAIQSPKYPGSTMDTSLRVIIPGFPFYSTLLVKHLLPFADGSTKYMKTSDGLAIKRVMNNDSGEYTCRAYQISPTINNVKEQTIRLNIQRKSAPTHDHLSVCNFNTCIPPTIPDKPRRLLKSYDFYYGYIKSFVNLTCEAIAEPSAEFTWKRDDAKMPLISHRHQIFTTENQSVLQVRHIHISRNMRFANLAKRNPFLI